jgi:hypothetical protein
MNNSSSSAKLLIVEDPEINKSNDWFDCRRKKSRYSVVSNTSCEDSACSPDPEDAAQRKSVLFTVAGIIIITEFCERVANYGFSGSLVLFFQVSLFNFDFSAN